MHETDERAAEQRLKLAVDAAADAIFAKGARPTLRQIENEVSGPRSQIERLLEEWAGRLGSRHSDPSGGFPSTDRIAISPGQRNHYALEMARATRVTLQTEAAARAVTKQEDDIREVEEEIARARERLSSLQQTETDSTDHVVRAASVEKIRQRISGLEQVLARLREKAGNGSTPR
jgi:plasmid replication DNA-binding protein KfrA